MSGPLLDPNAMPPEELARLEDEGYGHMIDTRPRCTSCGAVLGGTTMVGGKCIHCGD